MNSHLNTHLVNGLIEDRIRAAAEARLTAEYQRQPRASQPRRAPNRRWARVFSRAART
jgi:hypothetical protein